MWIVVCLLIGFMFIGGVAWAAYHHADSDEGESYGARSARGKYRQELLSRIGKPECDVPTATGTMQVMSERQNALWREYKQLEAEEEENIRRGR